MANAAAAEPSATKTRVGGRARSGRDTGRAAGHPAHHGSAAWWGWRMSEAGMGPSTAPARRGAVRLTFRYEGDQVWLVSRRRVDKLLPPDEEAQQAAERQGVFAEVRSADERVLDRRLLHDLVPRDREVFADPRARLSASPSSGRQGSSRCSCPSWRSPTTSRW